MLSVLFLEDIALVADAASSIGPALAGRLRGRTLDATADLPAAAVFEGADAIDAVADHWQELESQGGAATPFQSLAMARAATEVHLQAGEVPRIVMVHHGDRPVVILPTVVGSRFGLTVARFLGDPIIQYGDALCAPGTARRYLEAAFHAAADRGAVNALLLRKVRHDARIAPVLRNRTAAFNRDEAPFLDIATHRRDEEPRQVRRARRKLSAIGPLRLEVTRGVAARDHLRDALALKRRWLETRRLPSSVVGCDHWEAAIERLAGHDGETQLCLAVLHVGDRPAAYEIAFTAGGRWYSFLGAIAEDFSRYSAGRVQVADTISWCQDNGFDRYDLLAPADEVKRSYCSEAAPVADYSLALRPAGHLLAAALRLTPVAKAMLFRLPAPLRKAALSIAGR